ncbi:MAG: hypothetical protein IKK60_05350, partial [Clostridia bacterium]|nr:hypothetical protein [Clostridia bacterium]
LNELKNDPTTNADDQDEIDALEKELEDIIAGITDGSLVKPDYTNYNTAVNAYEALKDTMTAEDKAAVEAIKAEIAQIPADGTKADYQAQVDKAAEDIAAINAKYGDCANGNHTWGEPVLTKEPTAGAQGEYTETCGVCGATQITKVDLADYDEFNTVVGQLEDLLDTENLTDEAKAAIEEALEKADNLNKNLPADVTTVNGKYIEGGQDEIDALVNELKDVVADTNAAIADGSALKPDYEAWEEAKDAYDALEKENVKDEIITEAEALKAEIAEKQADDTLTQATATQDEINEATNRLNEIVAGITDGTLKDPADYTEVDKDLADAKDKAGKNDVVDGVNDDIQEIEDKLNELKNDPTTNADDQDEIDTLEKELEDIIAGIEDGSLVKPDYSGAEKAIEEAEQDMGAEGKLSEEDQKALDDLKAALDEIKNDPTSNKKDDQAAVDSIKDQIQQIADKYAGCAKGNHTPDAGNVVAPDCDSKGYTEHICTLCGQYYVTDHVAPLGHKEVAIPAVEPTCSSEGYTEGKKCSVCGTVTVAPEVISKLPHTDEDQDGVCDVCGATDLYAGCACLCHNDHWFWHIVYLIVRIIWRVFNIHQTCACGAIHFK